MDSPQDTLPSRACSECGGTEFDEGEVAPGGGHPHVNFYPDDSFMGSGGARVRARRCLGCGSLKLLAKPDGN